MDGITPTMEIGGGGLGGAGGFGGIIGLLAVLGLVANGGGLFGGNNNATNDALLATALNNNRNAIGYENLATSSEVQRGFDNQNLQAQTRDILGAVTNGTAQTIAASTANATNAITAIKDGNASLIREFGNVETALTALGGQQQQCCCEILRGIDGINYNAALNTASINANTTAQVQKILDAYNANRMADMQNQINQLQLAQATSGLLRYPTQWTYNAGQFPPMVGGCCGGNNI